MNRADQSCLLTPVKTRSCIGSSFGALIQDDRWFRPDKLIADAVLEAVAPFALDAAIEARAMLNQATKDRRLVLEIELQQARYDASLAERRYAACDPDNRLIASELEKGWEEALGRVRSFEERLDTDIAAAPEVDVTRLEGLAQDLETA